MSISLKLSMLAAQRELVPYEPTIKQTASDTVPCRQLWLTPDAYDWCRPSCEHPDARIHAGCLAYLGGVMDAFVAGKYMEEDVDITWLDPHERNVWELKSYFVQPFLRLFGSFILPRVFIATHGMVRDDLENSSGPNWDAAINKNCRIIDLLFRGVLLYKGGKFKDYVG